jgi:hypothetical protein
MGTTIKAQRGVSMLGIFLICAAIVLVAVAGLKIVPAYMEYGTVKKAVIASKDGAKTVADVQKNFDRRAQVDDISVISARDLEVTKEGNNIVVSFKYDKKIPMFQNLSVLLEFSGSSNDP